MLRRHLCLVRAWSAAGLLTGMIVGAVNPTSTLAAPAERINAGAAAAAATADSVTLLDAEASGDLAVNARGAGQYQVKMTLKNNTDRRLNVVVPPGLVASSVAGQGRGGFQSMGLGSVRNRPGAFGEFQGANLNANNSGFRSIGINADLSKTIAIPPGASVDVPMPSVCLNYGIPTPGPRDSFKIVAVEDYSKDLRVHRALKSLAALGTSQGVAQAAMWRVCNNVSYELMAKEPNKVLNTREIALAKRFVDALDASGSVGLVDPTYLNEARIYVRVGGANSLATDAGRLNDAIEGVKVLGLPARAYRPENEPKVEAPALLLDVTLNANRGRETAGTVVISQANAKGVWEPVGKGTLADRTALAVFDGEQLGHGLSRLLLSASVSVKTVSKGKGVTAFRVENRLPFTVGSISVRAGQSLGSPVVPFNGLGIAPGRSSNITVQAPFAVLEQVELNGL